MMTDNNSNPTRDMIDALDKDNNVDAEVHFKNALSAKVGQELDDKRKDIASTIMAKEPEKTNDNNAEQSTEIDD
tara:strand:+ start:746 stop:967 length:222 start_codon:yes stop_codon:yes gene_type:complete